MKKILCKSLSHNLITNIKPLTENTTYNAFTDIILTGNSLNVESITIYLPMLEERGVEIKR
jgi:hypothetical protein